MSQLRSCGIIHKIHIFHLFTLHVFKVMTRALALHESIHCSVTYPVYTVVDNDIFALDDSLQGSLRIQK